MIFKTDSPRVSDRQRKYKENLRPISEASFPWFGCSSETCLQARRSIFEKDGGTFYKTTFLSEGHPSIACYQALSASQEHRNFFLR